MEEVAVKKRGRPPKNPAAAGSQQSASPSVVDAAATIPKKRGRPPKSAKVQVQRGRPAKKPVNLSDSEGEGDSDDDSNENVAKTVASPQLIPKGRGRPRINNYDAEVPAKSKASSPKRRKLGRPKKYQPSESEDEKSDDDDEEIRRRAGRPPTGSVNLNIVRTGRGQGRPKTHVEKRPAAEWTGDGLSPKKRGRPSSNKPAYVPTGRPRGRPKVSKPVEEEDDDDEDGDEDSVEEQPEKAAAVASPPAVKKRGRPPGPNKSLNEGAPKPRGRPPKANHSALNHDHDGDESTDDAASKKPADRDRGFNDAYEDAASSKEDSKSTCDGEAANDTAESIECVSDAAGPESATA
ncbi:chromosomal protein D1 [Drosophila obscura]|uniref:chromosomal protein D1 n=1 Tax=Drosophila obscura TaxID=7282 RepID=UPI000BA18030|nr:chromosomal protein D1 [Drosophila obscura]XP_041451076.1 chromosomal protein D1 [Drosophila obscura]